jgi:hypothetical protein
VGALYSAHDAYNKKGFDSFVGMAELTSEGIGMIPHPVAGAFDVGFAIGGGLSDLISLNPTLEAGHVKVGGAIVKGLKLVGVDLLK